MARQPVIVIKERNHLDSTPFSHNDPNNMNGCGCTRKSLITLVVVDKVVMMITTVVAMEAFITI